MKNTSSSRVRGSASIYLGGLLCSLIIVSSAFLTEGWVVASKQTTPDQLAPHYSTSFGPASFRQIYDLSAFVAPPSPASNQVAGIIGLDAVTVSSAPAIVDSFDSARGAYSASNKGSAAIVISNRAIAIEGSKIYGDVRSATSSVTLKTSSLVTGNVVAGATIVNNGTIQGTATQNSPSSSIVAPSVSACSPFTPANRLSGKFSYDAVKGDLTLGGNSSATLSSGTYCFRNLTLSGSGKLVVSRAVTIYLTGQFNATGNSSTQTGGIPSNLQISSSYTGDNGVALSGTTDLYMTMYAPQTSVNFNGTPQLFGAVLGKTLTLTGNPRIHFDSALAVAINSAPIVSAGSNQTIALPIGATLSGSATDDGLPNPPAGLTYQWNQVSGPAAASIANSTQASTSTSFPVAGVYVFRLTASDGALSGSAEVQVTVNPPVNTAPVVSAGANQTITLPATATLNGSAGDDGLPNPPGALTYHWSQSSGPAQASIANPMQLNTIVSFPANGTYVFRFTASDSVLSSSATVQVIVNPQVNQPPNVDAGQSQMITMPATASVTGSASDDGLPNPPNGLTYAWSQVSGPAPAALSDPTKLGTTGTFLQPGVYVLRLTASDGALSSSATTQITVLDGPPVLSVADRTISVGTKISIQLAANDPNPSDTLTYFLDASPMGATFGANLMSWMPTAAQVGENAFTARVVDANGHSDTKTFRVTVTPANQSPQLAAQGDERVPTGGSFARTLVATDPDLDALTFELVSGPAGLTLSGNHLSWNPVTNATGDYFATVKVADAAGAIDSARFKLTVFPVSGPALRDDSYETSWGQTLFVNPLQGVLANDADPNGGVLTAAKLTNPDKGAVSGFSADGSFTYVAPPTPAGPVLDVKRALGGLVEIGPGISPPLVADVDGDGKPDIITNQYIGPNTGLYVNRGDTGALIFAVTALPPEQVGGMFCIGFVAGEPTFAVADIDDDGRVEIVRSIRCGNGYATRIVAVAYDASLPERFRVKWLSAPIINADIGLRIPFDSNITVARLSPDEKPAVLLGGTARTAGYCAQIRAGSTDAACRGVWALNGDDGSLKRVYYSAPANQSDISQAYGLAAEYGASGGFMGPVVADVDDDGVPEILYEGTLWNRDGTVRHQFDGTKNSATQSSVVVNLDGDAQMEIVTIDAGNGGVGPGLLQAWEAGGQIIWQTPLPRQSNLTKLSVADVDRDGRPDFVFGLYHMIWVIDHTGRIKWLHDIRTAADGFGEAFSGGTTMATSFPVYDLNGDGTPEVIVQYGNNTMRFLRGDTGQEQSSWTHPGLPVWSGQALQSPIVADVDGTGQASVVFQRYGGYPCSGCQGSLWVLRGDTVPWQPAPTHYNQNAYWESNFNADGSVPTTYARQTADPRTNVFGQQPQAPYPPGFRPATDTSFTYAATNAAGLSNTATVNINIAPKNRAPKFTSKPPTAYLGSIVNYQAHAVDPDPGDTVTYGLAAAITDQVVASVDPTTGLVHLSRFHFGEHTFVITATDSHGAVGVQKITLRQASGTTTVPALVGMMQTDAASSLTAAQLSVGEITGQHTSAAAGTVLGQSPAAGTALLQGETVDLTVSLGPAPAVVPNVVGSARTAALTTLSGGGFTATVTQVLSDTVPAGTVIAQSPAPGTFVAPTPANPIALTVSAGTGLSLSLTRSVTTADQTIIVTPAAFDVNGAPSTVPALTYTIAPKQIPFPGALPTLSGTTITPGLETRGSFTITATDAANSRSVSQDFAVLPPREPGTVNNGESFAHMAEMLEQMHALREPLKAALAANDTAQMTILLQQMVTLWRTVDLDDLRISQPLAPTDGFAPTVAMMKGFGHSATPDDVISHQVLKDSIEDLTAWTEGLKSSSITITQLNAMADRFSTRAARMDGLVISRYGGINNKSQYTRLMTRDIPNFYEALTNELALLTGMPVRQSSFPFLAQNAGEDSGSLKPSRGALSTLPQLARSTAKPRRASGLRTHHATTAAAVPGTLAELAVTQATQMVVDKVMEDAKSTYKNAKKYVTDLMAQAAWSAAAVSIASELRHFLEGQEIVAVVSGASLSFREFQSAPSWIETSGNDDPSLNIVMVIGPDLAFQAEDFIQKMKNGYNKASSAKFKNAGEVKKSLSDLKKSFKDAQSSLDKLKEQAKRAFQSPDEVENGCLFSADAICRQLIYHNGLQPVYTYEPPPGFKSLGGLPVPIIVIVYDAGDGGMYFGTPTFLPCTYVDDDNNQNTPKKIQCPNNEPFTP